MGDDKSIAPSAPLLTPPLTDVFGDKVLGCCNGTLLVVVVVATIVELFMMVVGCAIGEGS